MESHLELLTTAVFLKSNGSNVKEKFYKEDLKFQLFYKQNYRATTN